VRSSLSSVEGRVVRSLLVLALACAPLASCAGEIKKGTADDQATGGEPEPGGPDGGGGSTPGGGGNAPGAGAGDGATSGQDSGRPPVLVDGRVPEAPVEAGIGSDASAGPLGGGGNDAQVPDAGVVSNGKRTPLFVAVGYSGVRMVSRDLGKTWANLVVSDTAGKNADDEHLLRCVRFGSGGVLVAAGWKIWSSTDAINWTERTNPAGQWMGGMQFANNLFVAAGGSGTSVYSSNGTSWMKGADRAGEPARTVAYGNNMFVAATDSNNWWSTTTGATWTKLSGGHNGSKVVWCKDKFTDASACTEPLARNEGRTVLGEGVYISAKGDWIERSENGTTWVNIKDTKQYPVTDVAFGYLDGI
jgi:hypothetical protein